jgi:hypothetical protein
VQKNNTKGRKIMKFTHKEDAYIRDIFARMDLRRIREFLLYGSDNSDIGIEPQTYDERLKDGSNPIFKRLDVIYADNTAERDSIASDISHALAVHDDVYMEIGMKAGARLVYQLLLDNANNTKGAKE